MSLDKRIAKLCADYAGVSWLDQDEFLQEAVSQIKATILEELESKLPKDRTVDLGKMENFKREAYFIETDLAENFNQANKQNRDVIRELLK